MKKQIKWVIACVLMMVLLSGYSATAKDVQEKNTKKEKDGAVTFFIVRHGETMMNAAKHAQGWTDAPLTSNGEKGVIKTGKGLKDIKFDSAYSSDSGRTMQTARFILKENKPSKRIRLKTDSRFRELNLGSYEGASNQKMQSDVGHEIEGNLSLKNYVNAIDSLDERNPNKLENWDAESYNTFISRLRNGVDEIAKKESKNGDRNVLLVSHGLSISALLDVFIPEGFDFTSTPLKNGSVTKIVYKNNKYTVTAVNDLPHAN